MAPYDYKPAQYDFIIILICIGICMFISSMIAIELEKRENKFKEGAISILYILGFFLIVWLFGKYSAIGYACILLCFGYILISNIISIAIRKKHSKEIIKAIKVNCPGTLNAICCIILILESKLNNPQISFIEIVFIILLLINFFLGYSVNQYLNLYESGIGIGTFLFPKKIIVYDEIILYENIEKLTLQDIQRNKFILKIKLENIKRKSPYIYKIKNIDKEEFVSIIKDYIEEDKIIVNK